MKITLIIIISIIVVVGLIGYFVALPMIADKLVDTAKEFPIITHEDVFNSDENKNLWYAIGENKDPSDYGYTNWKEAEYSSVYDKDITLSAWWVQSASAEYGGADAPVIMLSHGRTANRLKPMKFLQLFKQLGLDKQYNFFIPDHRNSGKSSLASTELGNKFAEDIAAATFYCQDNFNCQQFIYYSFSMGAMATGIFMNRPDLKQLWMARNIQIEKLIFDSPLSNVDATLRLGAAEIGAPAFIIDRGLAKLASQFTTSNGDSYYDQMKLSVLLKTIDSPILILNSRGDITTPASMLTNELKDLTGNNIELQWFDPPKDIPDNQLHVQMYNHHKDLYTQTIKRFL